jgi:RimJ/RimL family protein N-acetyltransferase
MQKNYSTKRLTLDELNIADTDFIFELVNTAEWKKFIGERNINSKEDAVAYTQKIIDNPNISYWVVKSKEDQSPIGVITIIKRDYLPHRDIGFAFLPAYGKKGYAKEAANTILNDLVADDNCTTVLATTIEENYKSIQLLEKLGLDYSDRITNNGDVLLLYSAAAERIKINKLVTDFFSVFNNCDENEPAWQTLYNICIAETIIIKKTGLTEVVYHLDNFIEPRKKILRDGSLRNFNEAELLNDTWIKGNIAQRHSRYQKEGYLNGNYFKEYGHKFFQLIKTTGGWKINAMIWEDDIV